MGMRPLSQESDPGPQKVTTEDVRGQVAGSACGRKHRTPGGAARRSRRSWLRQDCDAPFTRAFGASAPERGCEPPSDDEASRVTIVARPKLEVRRQARLHLVGSSGKRMARSPDLAAARLRPRMSLRSRLVRKHEANRDPLQGGGRHGVRPGIGQSAGCS